MEGGKAVFKTYSVLFPINKETKMPYTLLKM